MNYKLKPLNQNVTLTEIKAKEVTELTGKSLVDVEASKLDVLNYGRIVESTVDEFKPGQIVLYQKLAAHKTNFGTPRESVVPVENIEATLEEIK